jgi:major membrane immunogen (membrane-anchored lipoprotein)
MKKLTIAFTLLASLCLTACHYGVDEATKTLKTNDLYKGDKKDYSTNRGNDGVRPSEETNKLVGAEATVAPADTTKK